MHNSCTFFAAPGTNAPSDHPVRLVDEILDQLDWTQYEAAYHGRRGQPPIHPSVLAKVLLFAMLRRVRSSRQIEYELKHSIDFMWLASGRHLDHTTLSEFRRRHAHALRGIFRQMIKLAIDLGIARLGELCIDGTRVLADANRYKTWTAERLDRALAELDRQLAEALAGLEQADAIEQDLFGDEHEDGRRRLRQRMSKPDAHAARFRRRHFRELPFAVIKVGFALRRFLLRGIAGGRQEWCWAAMAFNLKKLMTSMAARRPDLTAMAESRAQPGKSALGTPPSQDSAHPATLRSRPIPHETTARSLTRPTQITAAAH